MKTKPSKNIGNNDNHKDNKNDDNQNNHKTTLLSDISENSFPLNAPVL